ncbi:AAA family ATPase [uncultured Bradyrhizobium sp.]|uniref:KGGVGR-motif variant AAA ATPase n=1 Tax=uncultured Bradyrhizobium sp. TaxID=199684 RepID=UPI00261616B3|nr:AAA family ATPase [uncultured Bradyrhizobium sp.]
MKIRFDDSLPRLCELICAWSGNDLLSRSAVVRDAGGRLAIVLPVNVDELKLEELKDSIRASLGAYARPDDPIVDTAYPGAQRLLEEASRQAVTKVGPYSVRLLDRRVVGSDWLRSPAATATEVPRFVFSSLKGGVGRSTALCIVAAHMSRKGLRVLAIDFDLEAPGIGTMLLDETELPDYGMLDYLVEANLANVDDDFVTELTGDSFLGASGARVTVIPAIGRRTLQNPENALAKLARAYLESTQEDGALKTITDQLSELLDKFDSLDAYDVVLIDGRAGLHETAASLILGIGAEVLLFGLDQPQTFQGYRLLMGQLDRYPSDASDDWRDRISFVHAKAPDSSSEREEAASRFHALLSRQAANDEDHAEYDPDLTENDFDLEWEESVDDIQSDDLLDVEVLHVLEDTRYRAFDPVSDRRILESRAYADAFSSLLQYVDSVVVGAAAEEEIEDR